MRPQTSTEKLGLYATLAISAWFIVIIIPFIFFDSWSSYLGFQKSSGFIAYQIAGFSIFAVFTAIYFSIGRLNPLRGLTENTRNTAFLAFFVFCIISGFVSERPTTSVAYSLTTLVIFFVFVDVWRRDPDQTFRGLGYIAASLLAFCIILFLIHPYADRNIGAIQPNSLGRIGVIILITSFVLRSPWRYLVMGSSLSLILAVSSRGSLAAAVIVLAVYGFIMRPWRTITVMFILVACVMIADLALHLLGRNLISVTLFSDVLYLDDPVRGVLGGFTGRFEIWAYGFQQFLDQPLIGYGFRTRETAEFGHGIFVSAHSGVLNLLLDVGIMGFGLFFVAIIGDLVVRIKQMMRLERINEISIRTKKLTAIIIASTTSYSINLIYDPQYLNIGHPYPLLFLFLLTAPYPRDIESPMSSRGP